LILGGGVCGYIICFIQKINKSNEITERKLNDLSLPGKSNENETNMDRVYESVEDYVNTTSVPTENHEVNINLIQNQAYALVMFIKM